MTQTSYHEGELQAQQRAGETDIARRVGRAISDRLPAGAHSFVSQQRMVIAASVDSVGRPWASVVVGEPGFAAALGPRTLGIDLSRATLHPEDPLQANLSADARIGTLFIDLEARRRLRVNGRLAAPRGPSLQIAVDQAYPNCAKYIQRRRVTAAATDRPFAPPPAQRGTKLKESHRSWIESADTVFVASAHPQRGLDASHRGGNPGFLELPNNRTILVPDYRGNSMYNTLGNFLVNPRAGLLLVDFTRRAVLQLTGRVEALWRLDRPRDETGGTYRYWELTPEQWIETELAPLLDCALLESSPFNPRANQR